ncbi:MAG: Yip1 family protein, partial [Nanoarchaeota archaeon]
MIQKGLAAYIREQLRNGYKIEALRQAIIQQGYSHTDTEDTINSVIGVSAAPVQPIEPPHKKLGFFQKMENVLFHPNKFFSDVKTEGIRPSVIYLLTFTFLFMVFFSAVIIVASTQISPIELNVLTFTIITITLSITFIFFFASIIIWILLESAFTQSIAKLLGGKGTFADSVKAMTYSLTPFWLTMILLAIVVVPTIMFLPDFFNLNGLTEQPPDVGSLGIAGLFFSLVMTIAVIWTLIINV